MYHEFFLYSNENGKDKNASQWRSYWFCTTWFFFVLFFKLLKIEKPLEVPGTVRSFLKPCLYEGNISVWYTPRKRQNHLPNLNILLECVSLRLHYFRTSIKKDKCQNITKYINEDLEGSSVCWKLKFSFGHYDAIE